METSLLQDARTDRLWQLSEEYGLSIQSPPPLKPKPDYPPSYRTDNDVFLAEELLRRQRGSESQHLPLKGGLSRAFTNKKAAWEYREIYDALLACVTDQGSPGVAEARKQPRSPFFYLLWLSEHKVKSSDLKSCPRRPSRSWSPYQVPPKMTILIPRGLQ